MTKAGDDVEARAHFRMPLKAGPHTIGVAFLEQNGGREPAAAAALHPELDRYARHDRPSAPRHVHDHRPVQSNRPGRHAEPPPDLRLPSSEPRRAKRRAPARSSRTSARRAYRGVGDRRRSPAVCSSSIDAGRRTEATSRRASRSRCSGSSPSPKFVFRVERDPANVAPARCTASATSSWRPDCRSSSGAAFPTTQLLRVARQGKLKTPAVLEQQVRRMLADPKAEALVDQLRRPVAVSAEPEEHAAELGRVPRFRRQPAAGLRSGRRSCSSRASCARTATCSI